MLVKLSYNVVFVLKFDFASHPNFCHPHFFLSFPVHLLFLLSPPDTRALSTNITVSNSWLLFPHPCFPVVASPSLLPRCCFPPLCPRLCFPPLLCRHSFFHFRCCRFFCCCSCCVGGGPPNPLFFLFSYDPIRPTQKILKRENFCLFFTSWKKIMLIIKLYESIK